jgi:hypothetical protein
MVFFKKLLSFALVFVVSAGLSFKCFTFFAQFKEAQVAQLKLERLDISTSTPIIFSENSKNTKTETVFSIQSLTEPVSKFTKNIKDATWFAFSRLAYREKANPEKKILHCAKPR